MPAAEHRVPLRTALAAGVSSWRRKIIPVAGGEVAAVLVGMVIVFFVAGPLALFADRPVLANGKAPVNPCAGQIAAKATIPVANQRQISDVSSTTSSTDSLDIYSGRNGGTVEQLSIPLSVQNGLLAPDECLGTVVSALVRADGLELPPNQVTSWAVSGNEGKRVFVYIEVSPRYGNVAASGGYTGTVSMDDERATGGNVPVNIHIEYPHLWRATMACIVGAWCGFFWAWLIHLTDSGTPASSKFWLYIVLQIAVLTVVAFPVLNAQVLTNPDWTGDMSQYVTLASLAGGGAVAATVTLRALVDRVVIPGARPFSPSAAAVPAGPSAGPSTGTTGAAPAIPITPSEN